MSISAVWTSALSPTWSGRRRTGMVGLNAEPMIDDVAAAVEVGPVGTVHLAPPPAAVGRQPQVGLVEVAEQQELADLPGGGEPHHVVHDRAIGCAPRPSSRRCRRRPSSVSRGSPVPSSHRAPNESTHQGYDRRDRRSTDATVSA